MYKFDNLRYHFVSGMPWHGGWGLAEVGRYDAAGAIPEARPGNAVEVDGIKGVEVLRHKCESGWWTADGVLAEDGTYYKY